MAEEHLHLIGRAKSGDDAAFCALIEPLIEPGRRVALGMLHNPAAAEDAVQEACLRAWRKLHTFRDGAELRPWFFGIVANQCRSIRRTRWWSVLTLADPPHEIPATDDSAICGADLRRELRALGHREQLAVVLFYYLDLPLEEVAAALRSTPAATRKRLARAAQRLRPRLVVKEVTS
jgi:RNA polymerase sigma factor (sigma-70 family)